MGSGSKLDTVLDGSFDAYGETELADLPTGTLALLKERVDAEVAKRLEDCKALMPRRAARKQKGA